MNEAISELGKRVKYLRRLKNLTQAQFAEKVGLSVNYISQIETGLANPRLRTLLTLAQGLDVEIKGLFEPGQSVPIKSMELERGRKEEQ